MPLSKKLLKHVGAAELLQRERDLRADAADARDADKQLYARLLESDADAIRDYLDERADLEPPDPEDR